MKESVEDPRLLAAAEAIADGKAVDWTALRQKVDPEQSKIIDELRALERFHTLNEEMPTQWGPLALVSEIGHGAFGKVYHAVDPNLQRNVALKVIRSANAPVDLDHALKEARLLAKVSHPNAVRVYLAERVGNEVGIAMELVEGRTLDDLVRQSPFNANEAILIGLDLCRALAAVHAAGILHGDIKARNVMRETGGRIVLMDFGAGKDLTRELRLGDDFAGTPVYLAPEVFAGQRRTTSSDIYSLGVLLYYLVSGSYPVEGGTSTEIGRRHSQGTSRRPLRDVRPDLPDGFVRVVERALAHKPEDRYESAGALEAALAQLLPSPGSAPAPWTRRTQLTLAAVALLVALGVGGTLVDRLVSQAQPQMADGQQAAATVGTYSIEAALFLDREGTEVRVQQGMRVAPGDGLSLQVQASVPAHVYVVNEDEQGEAYLLFPLPGQAFTNPLPAGEPHRLPGVQDGQRLSWRVTSAGGREHFLIFASPERLPAFEQMFAALPRPTLDQPVQAVRLSQEAVGALRGVGGLTSAPAQVAQQLCLTRDFATPLADGEETVRGVWIRQVTLENPVQ